MAGTNVGSVVSHFPKPQNGFTTTLATTITAGASIVVLASTGNYTNGDIVTLVIEPTSTSAKQAFTGTVDTTNVRLTGVVWTSTVSGSNVGHTNGVTVVDYVTATHLAMMSKGILVDHTQAGRHIFSNVYDPNNTTLETLKLVGVASAVNEVSVTNAVTTAAPIIAPTGNDTNIDLNLTGKGTGEVQIAGNKVSGAWQSYTPTVTLTGGTSANGNAAIVGAYKQIGKSVHFRISYTVGTTTSFTGLTSVTFSLPVSMVASWYAAGSAYPLGTGYANIAGSTYDLTVQPSSVNTGLLVCHAAGGSYTVIANITNIAPNSWTIGNSWAISGTYEAA